MALRTCLISCVIALLTLPALANGAEEFERVGSIAGNIRFVDPDARAIAMGTAVVALPDGPSASYWNLGVLGLGGPVGGLSYSSRDNVLPFKFFSFAGNHKGIGYGGHLTRMHEETRGRTIYRPEGEVFEISEHFGLLGAGVDVAQHLEALPDEVAWGVGLGVTYLRSKFAGNTGDGWDMDLGTLFAWTIPLSSIGFNASVTPQTGYVLRNVWDSTIDYNGTNHHFGREDRWGVAAVVDVIEDHLHSPLMRATVSWERRGLFQERTRHRRQMGGEFVLAGMVSARAGYIWNKNSDNITSWGFGFGLRPGNPISPRFGAQIDHAESEWPQGNEFDQTTFSVWVAL